MVGSMMTVDDAPDMIQIGQYSGPGYQPLVAFGQWRVAVLNYIDELMPDHISSMERHNATDEVFVILAGQALLVIGGNLDEVQKPGFYPMEIGKTYNVKCHTWHTVMMSHNAQLLIIENDDTSTENSEYLSLSTEVQVVIRDKVKEYFI
jgi:ureidoglycolate hydrolase